jgi:hypothetical protein
VSKLIHSPHRPYESFLCLQARSHHVLTPPCAFPGNATHPVSKPATMKTIMSGSTCSLGKGLSVAGSCGIKENHKDLCSFGQLGKSDWDAVCRLREPWGREAGDKVHAMSYACMADGKSWASTIHAGKHTCRQHSGNLAFRKANAALSIAWQALSRQQTGLSHTCHTLMRVICAHMLMSSSAGGPRATISS